MLRIYSEIISVITALRPIAESIARHDPDLARQLRRAMSSVALNTSEGCDSQGRNRVARYFNALGSQRETRACLEVAIAQGFVPPLDPKSADRLDHISDVLWRLTH